MTGQILKVIDLIPRAPKLILTVVLKVKAIPMTLKEPMLRDILRNSLESCPKGLKYSGTSI